jgi:AcrR family transcriptional regulator
VSTPTLRQKKKDDTRRMISQVATRLFHARGFDDVTVAEIAEAAGVAKMTVFNYFARKEELFFDRNEEGRVLLEEAFAQPKKKESPLDALHRQALALVAKKHTFTRFSAGVSSFWRTVENSDALRAYVREIREDAEVAIAETLAHSVGAKPHDPIAKLVAALVVGAWTTAYREALRRHRAGDAAAKVTRTFVELLERGIAAAEISAQGTLYARKVLPRP